MTDPETPGGMAVEAWDTTLLARFREEFELSKSEMERRLRRHPGLEMLNWSTMSRWESGEVTPRPAYQLAIREALEQLRTTLVKPSGRRPAPKKKRKRA